MGRGARWGESREGIGKGRLEMEVLLWEIWEVNEGRNGERRGEEEQDGEK